MMKMKKQIISWGMMLAAAFTLTNCAQEIENPNEQPETAGYPFEIVASTVDTKTVNDGMATKWAEDDQINLFHAVGETTEYVNDNAFSLKDLEEGKFEGKLGAEIDSQEEYDWFAFYPYSSYIKTPANTGSGYMPVGSKSNEVQEQSGNNSMAHIAGDNYPMCGIATAVPVGDTPAIAMSHLSSLIEVAVYNKSGEELTVNSVSFTGTEDIVGTYYIDFSTSTPTYKGSGDNYVSNTANLNVVNGEPIANDNAEPVKFYLAVKPFTAATGEKLILSVNGYSKELTMTKNVTFTAGKIKTLNFSYDKVEVPAPEEATEVEIVSSELGIANEVDVTSVENGLLKFAKGTNSNNAPKYYTNGSAVRMYSGNTLTVTAPAGCILTKIVFSFVSGYNTSLTCTNSNGYSNGTWTGELDKVEFAVTGSSQSRITKIVVTYMTGEVAAAEITSIEVVEPKTDYFVNTDFEAPKVNAIYSNGTIGEVEGAEFSGYDLSVVGTHTVTVTYGEFSTSYEITVAEPAGESYSLYEGELSEGDYIIVYNSGAMNTVVSSSRLGYTIVEVVDDAIYEPDASIVWHIAKSGSYWTIYNASAKKYAAGTGAKNKAQLLTSGTDDKSLWTASGTSTYEFVNKANAANNVNKNLRRNDTYGFACYATSTGGALTLYKKN